MKYRITMPAAMLLLAAVFSLNAADFQKIHFTADGTPGGTPLAPGFTMSSCWGAVGYHYNGSIYVAISNHITNQGNVALFRYDVEAGTMHFINDIKTISQAAGNWKSGESHYKIHSQLPVHSDGTMYMTTQEDDNPLFMGAKMYTLTGIENVTDYTNTSAWYLDANMNTRSGNIGCLVAEYGIISLGVNPRVPGVVYGITYPGGYLLLFNAATGYIKRLVKTTTSYSDYISRYIGVDNQGNAYVALNDGNQSEQVYKFRLADSTWYAIGDPFPETGQYSSWGGFMAQVATASGDTLYGRTFDGQTIRVVYPTESVEIVNSAMPEARYADHNIAISADGGHLYSLVMNWIDRTTPGVRLYDHDLAADTIGHSEYIPLFQGYDLLKGFHVADHLGNFYVVGWSGDMATGFDNIALLKINPGPGLVEPNPPLSVWGVIHGIRDQPAAQAAVAVTDVGVWPSPFTDRVVIGFRAAGTSTVEVYDTYGRLVRTFSSPGGPACYRTIGWDGTDRYGQAVPGGVYFYHIRTNGASFQGRMIKADR